MEEFSGYNASQRDNIQKFLPQRTKSSLNIKNNDAEKSLKENREVDKTSTACEILRFA